MPFQIESRANFRVIKIYVFLDEICFVRKKKEDEKYAYSVNIGQVRLLTVEIYYGILGKCDCLRNMAVDWGSLFKPRISEIRYIIYILEIDSRRQLLRMLFSRMKNIFEHSLQ